MASRWGRPRSKYLMSKSRKGKISCRHIKEMMHISIKNITRKMCIWHIMKMSQNNIKSPYPLSISRKLWSFHLLRYRIKDAYHEKHDKRNMLNCINKFFKHWKLKNIMWCLVKFSVSQRFVATPSWRHAFFQQWTTSKRLCCFQTSRKCYLSGIFVSIWHCNHKELGYKTVGQCY